MLSCGLVMSACDQLSASGRIPALMDGQPALFMQGEHDGATVAAIIAVFASVWRVRAACRIVVADLSPDRLAELLVKCLDCPWLVRCASARDRKMRRDSRVRDPDAAPGFVIYRSDGASRGQGGNAERQAGFGAAVWLPDLDGLGHGPPHATCREFLGPDVSNNVAEYRRVLECLGRAVRRRDRQIVIQVDSMLVSRQLAAHDSWACRSDDLVPLRDACRELGARLSNDGIAWSIVHIFREYNQTADTLANQAVDEQTNFVSTDTW